MYVQFCSSDSKSMLKADIPKKQQSHVPTDPRLTLGPQDSQCVSQFCPLISWSNTALGFSHFQLGRYEHLSKVETFCVSSGAQKLLALWIVKYFFFYFFRVTMLGRLVRLASPLGQQVGKFSDKIIRDVADYQAEDRKYCWKGRFSSRCWLLFSKDGDEYNLGQVRRRHGWMNWTLMMMISKMLVTYDDPESLFLCC